MRTEPDTGELEEGSSAEPHADAVTTGMSAGVAAVVTVDMADGAAVAKVSEASKLFDQLFPQSAPTNTHSIPAELPLPVNQKAAAGETFIRKADDDSDEKNFQRVVKLADDGAVILPGQFVEAPADAAVAPTLRKSDDATKPQTPSGAQVIPASVDAVMSVKVKAELLAQEKAAKHAAKPEINFPARVNNLKTQHDQLRARLASLE